MDGKSSAVIDPSGIKIFTRGEGSQRAPASERASLGAREAAPQDLQHAYGIRQFILFLNLWHWRVVCTQFCEASRLC